MKKVKNLEFHSPFIIAGKNFAMRVVADKKSGVDAFWDEETDHVILKYKGVEKRFQSWGNFEIDEEQAPAPAQAKRVRPAHGE